MFSKKKNLRGLSWVRAVGFLYNDYQRYCARERLILSNFVNILSFLRDSNYLDINKIIKDYDIK